MTVNDHLGRRVSLVSFLGKLLEHHVSCERERDQEITERHSKYQDRERELEGTVRQSKEYSDRLDFLRQRDRPNVKGLVSKASPATDYEWKQIAEAEAHEWAIGRLRQAWVKQTFGDDGLDVAMPRTPWIAAFAMLRRRFGLTDILEPDKGAKRAEDADFDGEPDAQLREFVVQWRLEERGDFLEIPNGEPLLDWANKLDNEGRTDVFISRMREKYAGTSYQKLVGDAAKAAIEATASEKSPMRQQAKRRRKPSSNVAAKRKETKQRQSREDTIRQEFDKETWVGGYQAYAKWKNENLPDGSPHLSGPDVRRAVDASRKRQSRLKSVTKKRTLN